MINTGLVSSTHTPISVITLGWSNCNIFRISWLKLFTAFSEESARVKKENYYYNLYYKLDNRLPIPIKDFAATVSIPNAVVRCALNTTPNSPVIPQNSI